MNYLLTSWNIGISLQLTKITKMMLAINVRAICFHLSQHAENETEFRKRQFWLACFGGIFRIIQI